MIEQYGLLQSEKFAQEAQVAREIVKEIMNFGVSQKQMMIIIHSLIMNLENIEHVQTLSSVIRELSDDTYLIDNKIEE
jgi:archaellum biogenesis ATPase FlaH